MSSKQSKTRSSPRKAFAYFGLVSVLAMTAATAQISSPPGATGIDASGSYQRERAACLAGATQQDKATCLEEANNAAADKKRGLIQSEADRTLVANATQRCEALGGEDRAACMARVMGMGNTSGSVAGGGVIKEVETVVLPPGQSSVVIEPKTANPVLIVPAPQR